MINQITKLKDGGHKIMLDAKTTITIKEGKDPLAVLKRYANRPINILTGAAAKYQKHDE
jgi:hypothetical protein